MNGWMDGWINGWRDRKLYREAYTDRSWFFLPQVRLIDVGEVVIADVNQLLTLPTSFLTTPPLVIEVFLCGLLPPDVDLDWTPPVS